MMDGVWLMPQVQSIVCKVWCEVGMEIARRYKNCVKLDMDGIWDCMYNLRDGTGSALALNM